MRGTLFSAVVMLSVIFLLSGGNYLRLLRPSVLKQLNPDVVRLDNELPAVDDPNERIIARLFARGGLQSADRGSDGVAANVSLAASDIALTNIN